MAVAARTRIHNPAESHDQPNVVRHLTGLLGSHLSIGSASGYWRTGRVVAVGLYAASYPFLELASTRGLRHTLHAEDMLSAVVYDQPHGYVRQTPIGVERWCPTCYDWVAADPGDQELAFYLEHSHLDREHVRIEVADLSGRDVRGVDIVHDDTDMGLVESWLRNHPGPEVSAALISCPCFADQS